MPESAPWKVGTGHEEEEMSLKELCRGARGHPKGVFDQTMALRLKEKPVRIDEKFVK